MRNETFGFDHPAMRLLIALRMVMTCSVELQSPCVLEVVLAEAVSAESLEDFGPIKGLRPITIQPQSKRFAFRFKHFISYAVTEEMFWQSGDEIVGTKVGYGWVRQLTQSPFLSFVRASTWAEHHSDDALLHFQFVTLDHTIDVVTTRPPEFSQLATL
jgi:hypothetical protein